MIMQENTFFFWQSRGVTRYLNSKRDKIQTKLQALSYYSKYFKLFNEGLTQILIRHLIIPLNKTKFPSIIELFVNLFFYFNVL